MYCGVIVILAIFVVNMDTVEGVACAKCVRVRGTEQDCTDKGHLDHQCGPNEVCTIDVRCTGRSSGDDPNVKDELMWIKGCQKEGSITALDTVICNPNSTRCHYHCDSLHCNEQGQAPAELVSNLACTPPPAVGGEWYKSGPCGQSKYYNAGERLTLSLPTFHIVGGEVAREHEFPWQVALMYMVEGEWQQICGGSILNHYWILTAAHCVHHDDVIENYKIVSGEHDFTDPNDGQMWHAVEKISAHQEFSMTNLNDDIALIRVVEPFQFSEDIQPVCEPDMQMDYTNQRVVIAGWGDTSFRGDQSTILKDTPLAVVTNEYCQEVHDDYNIAIEILPSMVCASDTLGDDENSSCQGDSGGPLVYKEEDGTFRQVGVVSFAVGCAYGLPAGYSRVTSFMDWIDENMPMEDRVKPRT